MTLFEFLVVAFALLYASAAMRLVGGLAAALERQRRYWVHLVLVGVTLLMIAVNFWSFWSLSQVDWTLPKFLFALLVPGVLYFCASALIPENPEDISSWEKHFSAIRVRYFSGLALWFLVLSGVGFFVLSLPLFHPARLGHLAGLALAVIGAISGKPRVHGAVGIALLILVGVVSLTVGAQPGWLLD